LESLRSPGEQIAEEVEAVLEAYERYLSFMKKSKDELFRAVSRDDIWAAEKGRAYEFHEKFVNLYRAVGENKTLFEYSIV